MGIVVSRSRRTRQRTPAQLLGNGACASHWHGPCFWTGPRHHRKRGALEPGHDQHTGLAAASCWRGARRDRWMFAGAERAGATPNGCGITTLDLSLVAIAFVKNAEPP